MTVAPAITLARHRDDAAPVGEPMTPDQRSAFERDGFLVVPGALDHWEVERYAAALRSVQGSHVARGAVRPDDALHLTDAFTHCSALTPLATHPSTFGLVWSTLGWNIHVYHSHLDIHPGPQPTTPLRFGWHQDGGRQNRELETHPRPRLSVKVAYWLSDLTTTGRGNIKVVPGSHLTDWIDGPPRRDVPWPDPPGAIELTARPGDALLFDRRLWHSPTPNRHTTTRLAVFVGHTHRWISSRDQHAISQSDAELLGPVERQMLDMLDATDGDHLWGHDPSTVPLYASLAARGALDGTIPALRR